jgi:hypothetical protein
MLGVRPLQPRERVILIAPPRINLCDLVRKFGRVLSNQAGECVVRLPGRARAWLTSAPPKRGRTSSRDCSYAAKSCLWSASEQFRRPKTLDRNSAPRTDLE